MLNLQTKIIVCLSLILLFVSAGFAQETEEPVILDDVFVFEAEDIIIEDSLITDDPVIRPGQVTVFDKSAIEASGARNVADVIERAPGVVVSRQGGILEPQSVSIRGGASDHVLVLIDGKPAESLWSGSSDLSRIPVQNIERIEVIRGAGAAVYGEGAFSGVINIITVKNTSENVAAELEYGYASFNTHMAAAEVSGPISEDAGISGKLSGGGIYTGGSYAYTAGEAEQERENNDGWSVNFSGGARWKPGESELSVSGSCKSSERGTPGIMEFLTPEARAEDAGYKVGLALSTETGEAGAFALDSGISGNYSRYTNPDDNIDDSNSVLGLDCSADWKNSWDSADGIIELTVSGGYGWNKLDSTALTDSTGSAVDGTADQHSADLRAAFNMEWGRLDFTPAAGLDWSYSSYAGLEPVIDGALSWSAAIGYSPFRDEIEEGPLYLKTNIGTAYKNPSFQDLFWPSGALASGNPDLKPERSLGCDAGVYLSFPEPELHLEAVGFISTAEDLIQWMPSAGGIWRPKNIGSVLSGGAELSCVFSSRNVFDLIDIEVSAVYSWLKIVDWDESSVNYGRQLAYRPEHSGRAGLLVTIVELLSFNIDASYLGQRYTNNSNTKYLDQALIFSAAVNYDINETFRLSATAENFTNQVYIDRLGYPIPGFEWALKGRISL
ncbi:MAG: TonB-dependent receptor [Spirochaetales bacterium]|nr:TonB-dependent receptor [Spirochaetales bacterium]